MKMILFLMMCVVGFANQPQVIVVQPQGYIPVTYIPAQNVGTPVMYPQQYAVQQMGGKVVNQAFQPAANFVNNSVQAVPQSMREMARYSRGAIQPKRSNYKVKCRNLGLATAAYGALKDKKDLVKIGAGMVVGQNICAPIYKHTVGRVEGPVKGVFHGAKGLVDGTVGQFFK